MQRVRDLVDAGVEVTPYFVFPPSRQEPVDASLFWDKALPADPEDALFGSSSSSTSDGGAMSAAAAAAAAAASGSTARFRALTTIDDIVRDHVKVKEHKKRAMARLNLQIGGMEIAVQIYKMYQEAKKPSTIFINAVTNEPLKSSTEWLERTTGEAVDLDTQVKTYHPYGGVNVFFTKEEMRQIKGLAPQGLKLMGFKPLRLLRREHAIRGSSFVYPDDGATEGSHLPFAALHAEMLAMQVFAVCRMVARDSTAPRLVALVAQEEVRLPDGSSVHPYGMHLLELPFADDIRSLDGPVPDVTEPEIAAAAALSTKLSLNYSVHDFSNPTLTVVSGFIQSMALNAPIPEQFDNQLVPDSEGMERKRKYIDSFKSLLYPKAQPNALDAEWIDLYRATKLKKKTIPELKEYLKAHSLPGTGVKADLIERFRNLWELPE
jgi:ATP-dependent DNA helicase 2 subunit 1